MLLDLVQVLARWGIYLGAIGTAGSVFTAATLWPFEKSKMNHALVQQGKIAGAILLVSLIIMFLVFLLNIAGGDLLLSLSPDYVSVAMSTAVGRAFLMKFVGGLLILAGFRFRLFWMQIVGSLFIVGSFGLEGHSVSFGTRPYVTTLLLIHLSLISWWLAVIFPLLAVSGEERKKNARRFSSFALYFVPLTLVTGLGMWYSYTGGNIDIRDPYQIRLALKLALVVGILGIAAGNKMLFTERDQLGWPLRFEAAFGLVVTLMTAVLVTTSPGG